MALPHDFPGEAFDDGVFCLGRAHGFLPREPPLATLPAPFTPLQHLLDRMPVFLDEAKGVRGLLGTPGAIAEAVDALPDLYPHVTALDSQADARLLAALFRGYAFLASAYTLEPAHQHHVAHGSYGKARTVLPPQIARPFVHVADTLGVHPWLDYHYAYSLCNWSIVDDTLPADQRMRWDNLRMAVRFSGQPDEAGFILLHVHIDSHAGPLLGSIGDALAAARRIQAGHDAWPALRDALTEHRDTMVQINEVRREMWQASRWQHYNDFRVFIMGITGNEALFGDGVIYEGVERFGGEPQQFRGQTGAQDDIIPTVDVFSGVLPYYPDNELTQYLLDLRAYRPRVVRRFMEALDAQVAQTDLWALMRTDPSCATILMGIVEQVHDFRNGHWQFVQRYIMATTRYATATGGTPVTTWIPNQIEATLAYLGDLIDTVTPRRHELPAPLLVEFDRIAGLQPERVGVLHAQVAELAKTHYDAELVYKLNERFREGPVVA